MIKEVIRNLLLTTQAVGAAGWLDDAGHYFCEDPAWSRANARLTDVPECLLELRAVISPTIDSLLDLRKVQHRIWDELSYPYFRISSFILYDEAASLRFVTAANSLSCLTGRMIVGGEHYHELIRRKMHGTKPKPSAPFAIDLTDL